MKKLFFLLISILFCKCAGIPSYHDLGKNYYYVFETTLERDIEKVGSIIIDDVVVNYAFDSTFILVDQKPIDKICLCNDTCLMKIYKNWRNMPTLQMCLDAFEKSTFHQYWIINKKNDSVWGPFTKEKFIQKKIEKGVPNNLILEKN